MTNLPSIQLEVCFRSAEPVLPVTADELALVAAAWPELLTLMLQADDDDAV